MSNFHEHAPIEKASESLSAAANFDPLKGEPGLVRFENRSIIGEGGMGTVYKAYDQVLERTVAIKVLKQQGNALKKSLDRFERESRALAALSHNNIVTVHLCGFLSSGLPFMVMDYVEGLTLHNYLQNNKTRSWQEFLIIFTQVLNALISAHELSITHRDLKPENIMISKGEAILAKQAQTSSSDSRIRVRLLDFGVAKIATEESDQNVTATAGLIGTPRYMSPEQCTGQQADPRSDLYSLACIMYEYITGKVPFESENLIEMLYQRAHKDSSSLSSSGQLLNCSRRLKEFLLKALTKSPEHRFQSAEEMLREMQAIPDSPSPLSTPGRISRTSTRYLHPLLPIILILAAIFLITKESLVKGLEFPEEANLASTSIAPVAEKNKGDGFVSTQQYDKALTCYKNAANAAKSKHDLGMEYCCLEQIGKIQLFILKKPEAAVQTFQKLVDLSRSYSANADSRWIALENLARAYHKAGKRKEAIDKLKEANEIKERVPYRFCWQGLNAFENDDFIAQLYFELGNKEEAERLLNKDWKRLMDADPHKCVILEDGVKIVRVLRNGNDIQLAKTKMRELLNFMKEPVIYEETEKLMQFQNDARAESEALGLGAEAAKLQNISSKLKE